MIDRIDTAAEREWLEGLRNRPLSASDRASLMVTFSVILDALDAERVRAEKAEAERDQALARLAAAYEAADICALTPADAEAALQRVVDATWNEAVEAAAGIAAMHGNPPSTQWANGYAAACRENAADILAIKRGGQP